MPCSKTTGTETSTWMLCCVRGPGWTCSPDEHSCILHNPWPGVLSASLWTGCSGCFSLCLEEVSQGFHQGEISQSQKVPAPIKWLLQHVLLLDVYADEQRDAHISQCTYNKKHALLTFVCVCMTISQSACLCACVY